MLILLYISGVIIDVDVIKVILINIDIDVIEVILVYIVDDITKCCHIWLRIEIRKLEHILQVDHIQIARFRSLIQGRCIDENYHKKTQQKRFSKTHRRIKEVVSGKISK